VERFKHVTYNTANVYPILSTLQLMPAIAILTNHAWFLTLQLHLTKVIKHVQAKHADVTLRQSQDKLIWMMAKGLTLRKNLKALTQEHALTSREFNQHFSIDSKSGKGRTLFVQLPLHSI
jgi:hypothetical protein